MGTNEKLERQSQINIAKEKIKIQLMKLDVDHDWKDSLLYCLDTLEIQHKPFRKAKLAYWGLKNFIGITAFIFAALLFNHVFLPSDLVRTRAALETQIKLNDQVKEANFRMADLCDQQLKIQNQATKQVQNLKKQDIRRKGKSVPMGGAEETENGE